MNAYEQAIERLDAARVAHNNARHVMELAENELEAAWDNLSDHEERPGIPLPQYRTHTRVLPPIATTVTPWSADDAPEDHFIGLGHYDDPEVDTEPTTCDRCGGRLVAGEGDGNYCGPCTDVLADELEAELEYEAEQERQQQLHDEMIACDDGHRAW